MRNSTLRKLAAYSVIVLFVLQSCKDDSYLTTKLPYANSSFSEEFDTASAALSRGWKFINASDPVGAASWQNGGDIAPIFNAYSNNGSNVGFIGATYLSTSAGQGAISNWLVSPPVFMQNGDKIVFYARAQMQTPGYTATDTTDWGNRLQLAYNTFDDGLNVGSGYDPGDYTTVLVDINPMQYERHKAPGTYNGIAYSQAMINQAFPDEWTRFEGVVTGLPKPGVHRFAFRYLVTDGGNAGAGSGVGVDKVSFISVGK